MNASKCKYSVKMAPLVAYLRRMANGSIEQFKSLLNDRFIFPADPDKGITEQQALDNFANANWVGDITASNSVVFDIIEQKRIGEAAVVSYDGTARAAYGDDSEGYESMKHSFITQMVERLIYNRDNNEWYDPTKVITDAGLTHMDIAIFDYKKSLIDIIRKGLGLQVVEIDINSSNINSELTNLIEETLTAYQNKFINVVEPKNSDFDKVKLAYVILSNFNDLILEHTPFLTIKRVYQKSGTQGIDMYTYSGPKANLRQSWTTDEYVGAKEQYSGLAKTLLNYFQEWNNGFIENTSIGVDGFISAMKTMRTALIYSGNANLADAKAEYYKGDKINMEYVIETYLQVVKDGGLERDQETFLTQTLRGILYNIYKNNTIPQDIKSMFTRMFFETVPLKYRTYGTYNGEFKGTNLEDNWINNQNYYLQDSINGKVLGYRENPGAFDALRTRYGIEFSEGSDNNSGSILFKFNEDDGRETSLEINYLYDRRRGEFGRFVFEPTDISKTYDGKIAEKLIYDFTGYLITPEYRSYTKNLNGENNTPFNDFAGAIAITILGSYQTGDVQPFSSHNVLDRSNNVLSFHKGLLFAQLENPAKIASLVAGSETANTVKDVNGNNLPTNGLTSLAYETDEFLTRYKGIGTFRWNLGAMNPGLYGPNVIREGITINGRGKKSKGLNVRELYEVALAFDFVNQLASGKIYMQPTVNADKTKTLLPEFDIRGDLNFDYNGTRYNLQDLLISVAKGNGNTTTSKGTAIGSLNNALMRLRSGRYIEVADDLLMQYNTVFKSESSFETLQDVDNYLVANSISYDNLRKAFRTNNLEFVEEFTATKSGKLAKINETLLNKLKTFNGNPNNERFQKRLDRSKRRFAYDLISDGLRLNRYISKGGLIIYNYLKKGNSGNAWIDEKSNNVIFAKVTTDNKTYNVTKENVDLLLDPKVKAQINPILESFFYANAILTDDYNAVTIGEDFSHANKNKKGDKEKTDFDETEWEEFSEASRWVSSVKRNVIPGASLHPFLQYKEDGVAEFIKISAMTDIDAATFSIFGISKDDNDSMDGCGLGNIWEILLEKNSLVDAAPGGFDLKTIGWDLDANGIPMMLKWAVYGITNERRVKGFLSKVNLESLYKRMNDIPFSKYINLIKYFDKYAIDGFYFTNLENMIRYHVSEIGSIAANGQTLFYRVAEDSNGNKVILDKHNKTYKSIEEIAINDLEIKTIYDLDQFFGGALSEKQDENGTWKNDNLNYRVVLDIICSENLKDNFIAYAVNKSAMKVGVRNLNSKDVWFNNEKLDYFTMSTKHIGLQMNAEHELEFAEVTEMTQMISALAENWYAGELVEQIYNDIGKVVEESLASIKIKIKTDDRDGLRTQFGKALIESFDRKEDTIGLAQAFLNKARQALKDNERPNIPFSAATINGAFIADVASRLTKKGIRRKYSGIAAVLSPSYNVMSYFKFNEGTGSRTVTAEKMPQIIRKELADRGLNNFYKASVWDLCNSATVTSTIIENGEEKDIKVLNPFIEIVSRSYDLRQGDTIVVAKETVMPDGTSTVSYSTKVIEKYSDYEKYVNNTSNEIIGKLKYAARDLQGSDTRFTVNGQEFSVYNLTSVRALHALNAGDTSLAMAVISDVYWKDDLTLDENGHPNIKVALQNIIQHQLEDLEKNNVVHDLLFDNITTPIENIQVEAAECIMGKSFAEQFGLIEGDDINNILSKGADWFYDRFNSKYTLPADVPADLANSVLFTKSGPILVKFGSILNPEKYGLTKNLRIREVDGNLVLNDEILCESNGVETYVFNNEKSYNVLVINNYEKFKELLDSELVETHRSIVTTRTLQSYLDFTKDPRANELLNRFKSGELTPEKVVEIFNAELNSDYSNDLQRISQQRFWAFKASLNIVAARIPTQAMQSFMPMKVVAFTNSTTNDIYVTRTQLWLQGSDLDIDKAYCLQYNILSNGTLATMSRLSNDFDPAEVLKLGKPTGIRYEEGTNNAVLVSLDELDKTVTPSYDRSIVAIKKVLDSGKTQITFESPKDLEINVKVNGKKIKELNTEKQIEFNEKKRKFLYYLNKHSLSDIKQNKEAALRNMVVSGILSATLKPSVQGIAGMPIDMQEAQEAAENSVLGNLEKHFSPDIPSSKFKLQEQALGAKDVVGISAVSVKCFFAETTYMNMMMNSFIALMVSGQHESAMNLLNTLLAKNPITKRAAIVSNTNLRRVIDSLEKAGIRYINYSLTPAYSETNWQTKNGFDIIQCLKDLNLRASLVDTALSDSGILSSATDNMKELILPKLNATAQFVDIYTSLLAVGVSVAEIANIMTSPMFTEMSRLTQSNLLDATTNSYRLKSALEFFLNKKTFPRIKSDMLQDLFTQVGWVYERTQQGSIDKKHELDCTEDLNILKKALDLAYDYRNRLTKKSSSNDYYDGDEDALLEEYYNEEYVSNNKVKMKDASLEDLNRIINYLEECVNRENLFKKLNELSNTEQYSRFGSVEKQKANLKLILDEILPRTEEQQVLGRMLSINQGLRTDPYRMHSMIRSIENFINTRFFEHGGMTEMFILMKFLNDIEYRSRMIAQYDRLEKSNINILRVISTVPHFKSMFDVLYYNEYIQNGLSSKHQLVEEIARTLENENPYSNNEPYQRILNEKEYSEVEKFVNDWYITGWLAQQNFTVFVPALTGVYKNLLKPSDNLIGESIQINSLYNFATFKHLMEKVIIPNLQANPNYNGTNDIPNSFIMSLEYTVNRDKKTKKLNKAYRLPINMMTIDDSVTTINLYEKFLRDFTNIANADTMYGLKIGELFFLYNLIVNKDGFGRSSFTRIFESLVATKQGGPLINSFYDYIASIDSINDRSKLIKELTESSKLNDLKARIHQNIATSNINASESVNNSLQTMNSDFTFDMPYAASYWDSFIETVYPVQNNSVWGRLKLEKSVLREEILKNLKATLGSDNIVLLTDTEWRTRFEDDEIANTAPALIDNGKVYIRRSSATSATSIAHEFAHVILSGLRFNPEYSDFYYNVLSKIDISKAKEVFGEEINEYEKFRVGIDLKEEIFAKYLENWLSNKIDKISEIGTFLVDNSDAVKNTINLIFGTNIKDVKDLISFTTMPINDALSAFGSSLFSTDFYSVVSADYLIKSQTLASLKAYLKSSKDPVQRLIEECK